MDTAKVKQAIMLSMLMKEDQQGKTPDLQPEDGYITPYHRIGTVPPTTYSPYNVV